MIGALTSPLRLWRGSLRLRLTVASGVLAATTFAAGGLLVLTLYHHTLVADQEGAARSTAAAVATAAARGTLPVPIPMPVGPTVPRVQVLRADNSVLTGDPDSVVTPAMLTLGRSRQQRSRVVNAPASLPGRRAYVVAVPIDGIGGASTVVTAVSLDAADGKARQAADLVAITCAAAIVVVIVVAWMTAGRALRPVELMRRQAQEITRRGDLGQRLHSTASDELAELARTLNAMLSALDEATAHQRRFLADAAHELRTPLAGITATLEVAQMHPETVDRKTLIEELLSAHQRLTSLVRDLLTLARVDARAPARRTAIDMAELVRERVASAGRPGVQIEFGHPPTCAVLGDRDQIRRVVANVLDNAVRHATRIVILTITLSQTHAALHCADDGPGVAIGDREKIFERFVRLDSSRSQNEGGTGLGLAMVKELVEDHGGTVTVADRLPPPGIVFTITLPLAPATTRPIHRQPDGRPAGRTTAPDLGASRFR